MLLLLASVCLADLFEEREAHPVFIKEVGKMKSMESMLDEAVSLWESNPEDLSQEKLLEHIERLKQLNKDADKIINSYPKIPSSKTAAIPLKLVTSNVKAPKGTADHKTKEAVFPHSVDFRGFVAYGESASFIFEPVISMRNKTIGCYFQPLQNVTCEVKELEMVFSNGKERVFNAKYQLEQNGELSIFDFDKPIEFSSLEIKVLQNYGDKNKICLGDFDLFNRKE